jgi:hypothetical protein
MIWQTKKNSRAMTEVQSDSKLILASIYAAPGEGTKSFAKQLKDFSSGAEGQQGQGGSVDLDVQILKDSLNKYLELLKFEKTIFAEDDYATVITNAAILERFKVEAVEILANSENLTKSEDKTKVLKSLFGPETEYEKIYDQYYKEKGLVSRAQAGLAALNIEGILDSVIPKTLNAEDFDIKDGIFTRIDELKKSVGLKEEKKSFRVATEAFDEGNLQLTMLSLLKSDPKKLGALFAIMGDKENGGQIEFKEHKLTSHKHTHEAYYTSAKRLLVITACIVSGLVAATCAGALVVPSIAAFASVTVIGAIVGLVACSALSVGLFNHIAPVVKREAGLTGNELLASVTSNVGGTGISSNDAWNYFIAPIRQGKAKDLEESVSKGIETSLLSIQSKHLQNNNQYNKMDLIHRQLIQTIVPNQKEIMKNLGISYSQTTALTAS